MKKFLTMISAVAVLLSGILFTSCSNGSDNSNANAIGLQTIITSTYGKWYKYSGSKTIKIPLSDVDDENTSSQKHELQNVEVYVFFKPDTGLKVAVQAEKSQNVEIFNGLLTQSVNVTMGGVKEYEPEKFGTMRWAALILAGKFTETTAPKIFTNPDECIKLDDFADYKIQWKKVLTNVLINYLLGE